VTIPDPYARPSPLRPQVADAPGVVHAAVQERRPAGAVTEHAYDPLFLARPPALWVTVEPTWRDAW
jgi:hypothetical protein